MPFTEQKFQLDATGSVNRDISDKLSEIVSVKDFGAAGDGITNDLAAIQSGIDALNDAGGGTLYFPAGTYIIGDSGNTIASRSYGILLKSNVALDGAGMLNTTLKVQDSSDIDLINTDRAAPQSNISISNMTLDGNESNQGAAPSNGFNLWAFDITDFTLNNVKSLNPASWGLRIEQCDKVQLGTVKCTHSAESNSDGIHFVDTSNVTGSSLWVQSAGDDAFVIEATNADVANYSISGLYVDAENGLSLPARGVLLLGDGTVMSAARTISNVNLSGVVVSNAAGHGVILEGASYDNVRIDAVVEGGCSVAGLYLQPGNATYSGTLENCTFNVTISDTEQICVTGTQTYGTISDNRIVATISNPGDGYAAYALPGDYWTGSISVDYDPNGTKVSPQVGVSISGDFNDLEVSSRDANKNLVLQTTAQNNTVRIGYLRGGVTNDLETAAGATNNRFFGGQIQGTINNAGGATNKFFGTLGADTYGTVALNFATEADGTVKFSHGLNGTPTTVLLQLQSSAVNMTFTVIGLSSTEVDVQARTANSAALITTGTYTFHYRVSI